MSTEADSDPRATEAERSNKENALLAEVHDHLTLAMTALTLLIGLRKREQPPENP